MAIKFLFVNLSVKIYYDVDEPNSLLRIVDRESFRLIEIDFQLFRQFRKDRRKSKREVRRVQS